MSDKYTMYDTNALMFEPNRIAEFKPSEEGTKYFAIIPRAVLGELDHLKDETDSSGSWTRRARDARAALSAQIDLEERCRGNLAEGIQAGDNYFVKTLDLDPDPVGKHHLEEAGIDPRKNDSRILLDALSARAEVGAENFTLVTGDHGMYALASSLGINVERPKTEVNYAEEKGPRLYRGYSDLQLNHEAYEEFLREKKMLPEQLGLDKTPHPWEFFRITSQGREPFSCVYEPRIKKGKQGNADHIVRLFEEELKGFYLKHRSFQQEMAIHALLNPDIQLVNLIGRAGTGKTLLALAAGFAQLNDKESPRAGVYESVMVMRSPVASEEKLGFLPGDLAEKMEIWMQPIHDNFKVFKSQIHMDEKDLKALKNCGVYQEQAGYALRGRSLMNTYIIIDEAQNMTKTQAKMAITRLSEGSKIVLTGDPSQSDRNVSSEYETGIVHVSERMKHRPMTATVRLHKVERIPLVEAAAEDL